MKILEYTNLDYSGLKKQYQKTVEMIRQDDFYSAEVKKMKNTPYYRAKLDHTNRLLFQIASYNNEKYALMLEVIRNHAYDKSRFLKGAPVDESKIVQPADISNDNIQPISYINESINTFNILDKIISFDNAQYEIFGCPLPLVIIGSAGSGKTVLTLEKMKTCLGRVLYITHSPYLVENSRNLYYANQYDNESQEIDFLSYSELLETIKVPEGQSVKFNLFSNWLIKQHHSKLFKDANKLYEEFKGVITGSIIDKKYLSRSDYLNLGVKQSIFQIQEREEVYNLFEKYLEFLKTNYLYDSNMLSFDYLPFCTPKYDFITIDEIQDFTNIQLRFILNMLNDKTQFILSGDSNQIVHPNFFSWANIKTMFYQEKQDRPKNVMRILYKNYRNSPEVTHTANNILKVKNHRFGSIDKESHYLIDSHSKNNGIIMCLVDNEKVRAELNDKTKKSTKFAVIVLKEEHVPIARQYFQTPLIFSIHSAKGLEYENVILFNFISSEEKRYYEITKGVTTDDLLKEMTYARTKDKTDKSLEIYKFYINAFYVAITRAVKNLYIVESCTKHPLLRLLNFNNIKDSVSLDYEESSMSDWRKEAHKLELQGKQEQADDIRKNILTEKKLPWQPIDAEHLKILMQKAFEKQDKQSKLTLLEYAVIYQNQPYIELLQERQFKPAQNTRKAKDITEMKYFMFYNSQNFSTVYRQIDNYGINFRNQFNQTPLMIASMKGNCDLIRSLIENGADLSLMDTQGTTALQIALRNAYSDKKYAHSKLTAVYELLAPSSISIKADGKLIKIDKRSMEYFLLQLMLALFYQKASEKYFKYRPGFATCDFIDELEHFPNTVLLDRRKKRSYISSILSKNEINRNDPYNKKLFVRTKLGHYMINPALEIKTHDQWVNVHQLLGLHSIKK